MQQQDELFFDKSFKLAKVFSFIGLYIGARVLSKSNTTSLIILFPPIMLFELYLFLSQK